jgi:hypothetical protein
VQFQILCERPLARVTTYLNQYGCWISDPPSPFVRYAMKICNLYSDIR